MLCEAGEVREFLQRGDDDTAQDGVITSLCAVVGTTIGTFCEREFEPPGGEEQKDTEIARTFEYAGGGILSLSPYDLRELVSVRIDVDTDDPVELSAEEFRVPPLSQYGTVGWLRLAPWRLNSSSRWAQRLVEVKGKWGLAAVPDDVKQAAIITVATWLRRDVSAFSQTFSIDEARLERPEALPSAVVRMLLPHKRHAYV